MNVLIIGGTRYMGPIAVEKMLARGDKVTVYSRGNSRPRWWDQADHIIGDRNDSDDFRRKLKGRSFDAVIDSLAFRKEHVETAQETLEGLAGRYLMLSTGNVYMPDKVDYAKLCPLREADVDWSSIDYAFPQGAPASGWGKRHCEKWLAERARVPWTVVRLPAVLAWNDIELRMWWWVQRILDGEGMLIPMENRGAFPLIHPADAAENFLRAIDSPAAANQVYHIASEEIMFVERWVGHIARAAAQPCQIVFVPGEVIRRREALKNYSPVLTRAVSTIWDTAKAKRDFEFRTMPTAQWMPQTVQWYREEYKGFEGQPYNSAGYEHRAAEVDLMKKWQDAFGGLVSEFD
jgi:nucleoside-diphosphate-sugar epimerase